MAGIGFTLKRLAERDDLIGVVGAFTHGTIAAAGPWIFTVIALAGIVLLFPGAYNAEDVLNFRETIVYNFSLTLMLSGPVYLVVTRYLADSIHRKRVVLAPTALFQSLTLLIMVLVPFGLWFYFSHIQLSFAFRLAAYINMIITGCTWLLGVYVLALKDYMAVSRSFLFGMIIAFLFAQIFKADYGGLGMLIGFDIGQTFILFALISRVISEYPYKLALNTRLQRYYKRYWQMIFAGFFYNAAVWIDKWIMWYYAPEATILESGFRFFSLYDNATFLALLSIVPAIGLFIFSVETNFFLRYQRFYYDILEH
ncbi:MAG: exopolysaccharide Pel transporter PelG, partial [Rickettsiales bacterium]